MRDPLIQGLRERRFKSRGNHTCRCGSTELVAPPALDAAAPSAVELGPAMAVTPEPVPAATEAAAPGSSTERSGHLGPRLHGFFLHVWHVVPSPAVSGRPPGWRAGAGADATNAAAPVACTWVGGRRVPPVGLVGTQGGVCARRAGGAAAHLRAQRDRASLDSPSPLCRS